MVKQMFDGEFKSKLFRLIVSMILFCATFVLSFLILNFFLNVVVEVITKTFLSGGIMNPQPVEITYKLIFDFPFFSNYLFIYLLMLMLTIGLSAFLMYKFKSNFGNIKKDQKGSSRFATLEEIKQQYRAVPDKGVRYEGKGGIPVGRYKNQLFIDDSAVNNLIIGTTRSGKGETFVFSAIDLYSRANEQSSMILNDPKGELFAASKDTLEALGYRVEVLNLMNPLQSMSYNLLQLTIDAFLDGNFSLAQQYARSVAFMLYYDPNAKDAFWANSSTDLCTALILALCEQSKHEPEKINMYNVALMLSELGTQMEKDGDVEISALDKFFQAFPESHPARLQYATINFSGGQTRASILANTNAKLGIFTLDGTAKLTSQNSFDMTKIGFGRWIKGRTSPNTRIYLTFPNGKKETIRTDSDGGFALYHKNPLKEGDVVTFTIYGSAEETKISIISKDKAKEIEQSKVTLADLKKTINPEMQYQDIDSFAGVEEGSLFYEVDTNDVTIQEIMEHDMPTALFMITPDYDATNHVIASLYVKQVYTNLARVASNVEGGKCHREVIFLLDEFGNMPSIEGMASIVTVCLGRNIRFNLVIQSYAQLESAYGTDWRTIDGNCGNTLYLLTSDEETSELISKKLGEETIVTKSRSGQTISLSKSKTESVDARRLMTSSEVRQLKEGEAIILRPIKRQDKDRKRIKSYPIFLTGSTALKFRWEYLSEYYDTDKSINDIDIRCPHANVQLDEIKVDFSINHYLKEKEKKQNTNLTAIKKQNEQKANNEKKKNVENVVYKVKNCFGEEQKNTLLTAFNNNTEIVQQVLEMDIREFSDKVKGQLNEYPISENLRPMILGFIDSNISKIEKQLAEQEE